MKILKNISALFLLSAAIMSIPACNKSDRDEDTELNSSNDMGLGETYWNDVYAQLDEASAGLADVNKVPSNGLLACATITVVPALPNPSFPKTVTIDFGSTNCVGPDGRSRRGQIIAVFSGRYRDSLTTITITPSNYYVNDHKVSGTKTITNRGHINGVMTFTIVVQNGMITRPDGKTMSWTSNRTRRWIAGESTLTVVSDDVYEITGTASGTGFKGNNFDISITTALEVAMNCKWIRKGVLKITPGNLTDRIVDFGSGGCDDQATVMINGNTYSITLP